MNARPSHTYFEGLDDGLPARRPTRPPLGCGSTAEELERSFRAAGPAAFAEGDVLDIQTADRLLTVTILRILPDMRIDAMVYNGLPHHLATSIEALREMRIVSRRSLGQEDVATYCDLLADDLIYETDEISAAAEIEFEPWIVREPMTVSGLIEISAGGPLPSAVIAHQVVARAKGELVEGCKRVGNDETVSLIEQLSDARAWFEIMARICAVAEGRVISAHAVTLLGEDAAAA